jgi:hypothetical protein
MGLCFAKNAQRVDVPEPDIVGFNWLGHAGNLRRSLSGTGPANDPDHRLAKAIGKVEPFASRRLWPLTLFQDRHDMSKRPRHPIKLPDDEHVSFSQLIQRAVKFKPSQNPPGSTRAD